MPKTHFSGRRLPLIAALVCLAGMSIASITSTVGREAPPGHHVEESAEIAPAASATDVPFEGPEISMFASIDEARDAVPFEFKTPDIPSEFVLDSVSVLRTKKLTIVDILYETPDATQSARLAIATKAVSQWAKQGDSRFSLEQADVAIDGNPGVAVTARSADLTLGYLYWQADGLTYQLWYPGRTGPSLIALAETAE